MNLEKIFKNLIVLYISYIVLMIFTVSYIDYDAILAESNTETTTLEYSSILVLVIYFINLYLLYKFKPIGKTLFIPVFFLVSFFDFFVSYESFFLTPGYEHIGRLLTGIDYMLIGMIIALLYFTDIKDKFKET